MSTLLDRFCRYVKIGTQADETSTTVPSTPGQLELGKLLTEELKAIGIEDAHQDEHGIVMGTIPATVRHNAPTVALIAHVDTSPETSGHNVNPVVHENYNGEDIVLPKKIDQVIRVSETPELAALKGSTIITTDGTTLLGGDDKAGVAVIMETALRLMQNRDVPTGPIRVCFTCDEEIGKGVDHLSLEKLGADVAYTLDGGGVGDIDGETFSADLAVVTVTGINVHPGIAKDHMVNAMRVAGTFLDRLPREGMSPETTEDRQGFLHPYRMEGGVSEVTLRILIRDFETAKLSEHAQVLRDTATAVLKDYPKAKIDVQVTPQYRNMADWLGKEPRALKFADQAMRKAGIEPKHTIVRGGTDGSRLTELGLPTPNLSTGEHNIHSPLEWTCVEEMETAVKVLTELVQIWGQERI